MVARVLTVRWVFLAAMFAVCAAGPAHAADVPADTLFARQRWAEAADAYARLAKASPAEARHWFRYAYSSGALQRWDRAIEGYRRAESLGLFPVITRYNLACALARAGQPDSAFAVLERLALAGYRQPEALRADEDLAALRSDPRFAVALERFQRNATPCAFVPEARQLDYWLGEWIVTDTRSGTVVGASRVERILDQCVILENWTGRLGGTGQSFNAWNATKRAWQQHWVDNSGNVVTYSEGAFADGKMVFVAPAGGADGGATLRRLSFFDLGPGHVRQLAESSTDGGRTWAVTYDFDYRRKPATP